MIALLIAAQLHWVLIETRDAMASEAIEEFRSLFAEAQHDIAPKADVVLDFPEEQLQHEGHGAIAHTTWKDGKFVVEVDWRALLATEPEMRRIVAVHEACHLQHGPYLQRAMVSERLRALLEMRANYCSMFYLARKPKAGTP